MATVCRRIAESPRFQGFIYAVIVANAITLGLGTYDFSSTVHSAVTTLDDIWLGIFVVEIVIRIAAYGWRPWNFFRDGWNVFDFFVIAFAFAPGLRENATLLRLARLLRVVRLVSVMPDLRMLVRAMARSLAPIASLVVLTLLLMYVYGMIGWIIFNEEDPENWGDIGTAMLTLFQILTLENWPGYLEAGQEIAPASWIFFVSYVLIASFLVINILIAIIINSMEEVHDAERAEERAELEDELAAGDGSVADRLAEIRHSLDKLETQLAEGGDSSVVPQKSHGTRRPTKGGRMRA
ncbi:MAG TPA: ion transporter [Solirubrobacterales bacterium]|nr:ion transporter [Solirubrobacterales bacterium]